MPKQIEPKQHYTLWHPQLGFGKRPPLLFSNLKTLKSNLERNGLWPLQNKWRIVKASLTFEEMEIAEDDIEFQSRSPKHRQRKRS